MSAVAGTSWKRDLGLVAWQIRYEQRAYWRNRGRGIFTFVFPLMFLVIFASLNKGAHISSLGGIPYDDFFVPGILAYAVIATTFVNMAISTAILRDQGVLKRMQGTPLPPWAYVAARIGSTLVNFISLPQIGAMSHADAANYLTLFWGGAMAGRFLGAFAMRKVSGERVLAVVKKWAGAKRYVPLRPRLVVEVQYDQVTGRRFRHGTRFLRWRPDKAPGQCTFEQMTREARPSALLKNILKSR